jgi:hypothetical protein
VGWQVRVGPRECLFGGLYCPPLIPAGIQQNPGNSQNSRGIKFGKGTCQIGKTIPAEFPTEFKFRRNGSRNYMDGMIPRMSRNGIRLTFTIDDPKSSVVVWSANTDTRFGCHQQPLNPTPIQPPPSFMTPIHCRP